MHAVFAGRLLTIPPSAVKIFIAVIQSHGSVPDGKAVYMGERAKSSKDAVNPNQTNTNGAVLGKNGRDTCAVTIEFLACMRTQMYEQSNSKWQRHLHEPLCRLARELVSRVNIVLISVMGNSILMAELTR